MWLPDVNPVSFKRILPQWNAREQQDEARARYQVIGSQVGATLWRDVPIVRIFPTRSMPSVGRIAPPAGMVFLHSLNYSKPGICTKASRHRTAQGWFPMRVGSTWWLLTEASRAKWQGWTVGSGEPGKWRTGARRFDAVVDCRGTGAVEDLAAFGLELRRNHGEVLRVSLQAPGAIALSTTLPGRCPWETARTAWARPTVGTFTSPFAWMNPRRADARSCECPNHGTGHGMPGTPSGASADVL